MDEIENTSYIIPEPLQTEDYDVVSDMVGTIQTPKDTVSNSKFAQFESSANNSFSNLLGGNEPKKKNFTNEGFQIGEAYDRLSDGTLSAKYENFLQGVDNENRLAQEQSTGEQWKNGLVKFFGKTATAIGGGTIGSIYGIGDAITSGDWTAIYDNDFYDVMDDWNKQMDNSLSNYYTKEQRDMGFLESTGTANFWANDFLGGLSFTAGAIASEAIWAAATGGTSLVTAAGRYGLKGAKGLKSVAQAKKASQILTNHISKSRGIDKAINYGRGVQALNTTRMMYTSAGYEAGVESRMFKQEQEEAFDDYFKELGRKPTPQELSEFTSALDDKTNVVFGTNMALVGSSNLLIFGKLFNVANPLKGTSSSIKRTLFGEGVKLTDNVLKPVKRNITQRVAGTAYHTFKNPIIEGVYEEGGQSVTSGTAGNLMESMYNVDKDVMDFSEAFYEGMAHTYGTKEGRKEVFLGMLIGAVGGGGSSALAGQNPLSNIRDAARSVSKTDIARIENYNAGTDSKETASLLTGAYGNEVSKKVIEELARANALSNSTEQMNKAVESGDLHNYEQGRISGILSNIIYAENTGLSDLVEEQILNDIDNTPNEDLKEVGQEDKEVDFDKIKADAKAEYSKLKKEFARAKEFSNYVIGNIGKKEVKDLGKSTETLRTMLAYQQVMTTRTVEFAKELNDSIISEIENYDQTNFQSLKGASKIKLSLDQAETTRRREFYNTNRKLKRAKDSYEKITKQIESQSEQLTSTPESQQAKTAKLLKLQNKQKELLEKSEALRDQRDLLLQAIKVETNSLKDDSTDLFISQDVDNLEENLEKISNTIEGIKKRDYQKYVKIKSAITAYQRAIVSAKQMSEIIEDLTNSKTQLKGATRTFLSKAKEYSEPTKRLIKNLEDVYNQKKQEVNERDNIRDILSQIKPEVETTFDPVDTANNPSNAEEVTANIEQAIDDILVKYEGLIENLTDPESVRPTQDDFNRYIELVNQSKVNSDLLLRKSYENASKRAIDKTGLSKEDIKEFQDLSKKLSDWQIISGMTNNEVSLKDLLDQKLALQKEVSKTTNSPITPEQETAMIQGVVNEGSTREMKARNINTSDSVLVQKKGEEYNISHFKVEEYNDNIEIVKIKEPKGDKLGTLTFKKGEEEFTVGTTVTGRYVIDNEEDFNRFLDILDLKVMSFKGQRNTWSAMYSKNEDGQYELQDSFFKINEISSLENIIDSQKLYEVKPGEKIFFKVSMNDSFNTELINDPKITEKKLKDNVSIYVVNSKGDVLGQVKASNKYTEHTDKTKAIREQAGQFILDQINPDKVRFEVVDGVAKSTEISEMLLPFYTTVTRVYSGTPSVKLDNQGELVQQSIPEGSIDSYGIYKNGQIILNTNSKVKVEDVSRTYLKTIEDTPIVIVKAGNKDIAYPAQIKPKQENLGNQLGEIVNLNSSESDKIIEISNFLADNGISPSKYNLRHIGPDNSSLYDGTIQRIFEDVKGITTYMSEEEFLSKDFTPTRLEEEVTTSLTLSDRPFRNPKLEMSTESIEKDDKISDVYYERQLASTGTLPESYLEKVSLKLDIDLKPLDKLTSFNKKVISLYKDKIEEMVQERLKMTEEKQKESKKKQEEKCTK